MSSDRELVGALVKVKNAIAKHGEGDKSYRDDVAFYTGVVTGLCEADMAVQQRATNVMEALLGVSHMGLTPEEQFGRLVESVAFSREVKLEDLEEEIADYKEPEV